MVKVEFDTMIHNLENDVYEDVPCAEIELYEEGHIFDENMTAVWNNRQVDLLNREITELNKRLSGVANIGEILFYKDLAEYIKEQGFDKVQTEIIVRFVKDTFALTFTDAFHNVDDVIQLHKALNKHNA